MRPLQRRQRSTKLPIIHLLYLNGSSQLTAKERVLNLTDVAHHKVKLLHNWTVVLCAAYACLWLYSCVVQQQCLSCQWLYNMVMVMGETEVI